MHRTPRFTRQALLSLLSMLLLILSLGTLFAQERPTLAPLNPKFLATRTNQGSSEHPLGLRHSPVDYHHLIGRRLHYSRRSTAAMGSSFIPAASLATLPDVVSSGESASYDLRALGRVSPVEDQSPLNSCWSFATFGSMESCLLPTQTNIFSEKNLIYNAGFALGPNDGGNEFMSMAYLARWAGPLYASDDPYNSPSPSPTGPVRAHVQDVAIIPDRSGPLDNANIKDAIMTYGGVYSTYYTDAAGYNPSTWGYYYSGSIMSDHAITIVGWDDNYSASNFPTTPPGNGAFIVKNSWGAAWGLNGYFFISYYDSNIGTDNAVFYGVEPLTNYANIYQYDPLGLTSHSGYNSNTAWYANIFTAAGGESLAAVSTYFASPDSTYKVSIYLSPTNGPITSSAPAYTQSGTMDTPGYHTIPLTTPVALGVGQRFSVVIQLTTPGFTYPIPLEQPINGYSNAATASAGQSYTSSNGTSWSDVTTQYANTNVCIKAFTQTGGSVTPPPTAPPLSAVSMMASITSPQPTGTAIKLTATPTGGSNVQYQFAMNNGSGWSVLNNYSTVNTYTWTPQAAGTYTLQVAAQQIGSAVTVFSNLTFTVTSSSPSGGGLTGVNLTTTLPSPQHPYTTNTLTATPIGSSSNVQYKFHAQYTVFGLMRSVDLTGYTNVPTYNWRPSSAGTYTLTVYARAAGSTNAYDYAKSLVFTVR